MQKPIKTGLVWLGKDLRIYSNRLIQEALDSCENCLFVYIFDERLEQIGPYGFSRLGDFRKRHLIDAVSELKTSLNACGIELHLLAGNPINIITSLCQKHAVDAIFTQLELATFEQKDRQIISQQTGVQFQEIDDNYLIPLQDLPFSIQNLPDIFTQFRLRIEKQKIEYPESTSILFNNTRIITNIRSEFQIEIPQNEVKLNGEQTALKHLKQYIESGHIRHYKDTRNGLIEFSDSTKLSPYLSTGSLNASIIMQQVQQHENMHGANESTYWVWFELLWRDYFRNIAAKYQSRIFIKNGIKNSRNQKPFNLELFEKWRTGNTGEPFVDANMHELLNTGWMSNRGRQNVASYWVHDLNMDWRPAAAWFEYCLIDYDVYSNYGNWIYLAGLGNDPRPMRKFNIKKQAEQYDPQHQYTQLWLRK